MTDINGINGNNGLAMLAASPLTGTVRGSSGNDNSSSWFEALSRAWGQSLDKQAGQIEDMADLIGTQGMDQPSTVSLLTAESLKMSFLANSSSSSIDSVGKALETMARKG